MKLLAQDIASIDAAVPGFPSEKIEAGLRSRGIDDIKPADLPQDFAKILALLAKLSGGSLKGRRLLDVGCGAGANLAQARMLGADAVGVDLFGEYGGRCRQIAEVVSEAYGLDTADTEACLLNRDATRLDAGELGLFDVTVSQGMLEHVSSRQARREIVQSMVRLLKPGGHAVMICGPNALFPVDLFHHGPGLPFMHSLPRPLKAAYLQAFARRGANKDPDYVTGMLVDHIAKDMRSAGASVEVTQGFPLLVAATRANRWLAHPVIGAAIRGAASFLTALKAEPVIVLIARRTA